MASGSAQPWMIVCQLGRGAGDWGNPPKIGRNLNFSSGNFMKSTGNSRTFSWIQGVPMQQDPRNPGSPEISKEKCLSQLCWYLKQAAFLICLAGMILWQKNTASLNPKCCLDLKMELSLSWPSKRSFDTFVKLWEGLSCCLSLAESPGIEVESNMHYLLTVFLNYLSNDVFLKKNLGNAKFNITVDPL